MSFDPIDIPGLETIHTVTNNEGTSVLKLNEIVRNVVKERLKELEDPLVSITIDSLRKVLKDQKQFEMDSKPDFSGLFLPMADFKTVHVSDFGFDECKERPVDAEKIVVPITLSGTEYYVHLDDDFRTIVDKNKDDSGETYISDKIIGVIDNAGRIWKAVYSDDKVIYYEDKGEKVMLKQSEPDEKGRYIPNWESIEKCEYKVSED